MIISTSRPYFAPYPGFFQKMHRSDCLVLLDDVQFPRKTTWITRNRFKNDQGVLWMTIPIWKKGLGLQPIGAVRICHEGNWRKKHRQSLLTAYAHAPHLADHAGLLEEIFSERFDRITDLNLAIIRHVAQYLHISTPIVPQSRLEITGKGSALIIDICRHFGATGYQIQHSAEKFYDTDAFADAGIELVLFTPPSIIYPQLWGDPIHNLSILDLLMNCGPISRRLLLN